MDPRFVPQYRRKVKTIDELCDLVGPRTRSIKVIMCHGVFDLVHPGHVRHLLYAKSKGDVLVVFGKGGKVLTDVGSQPLDIARPQALVLQRDGVPLRLYRN